MSFTDTFTISTAAIAASMSQKKLNRLLDRKLIKLPGPEPGKGHARQFRLSDIYDVALRRALASLAVTPAVASALARNFFEPQRGRPIGGLFETGRTVLIATPDGVGAIHNIQPDGDLDALLTTESAIVVDIGKIISNVNSRLKVLSDENNSPA